VWAEGLSKFKISPHRVSNPLSSGCDAYIPTISNNNVVHVRNCEVGAIFKLGLLKQAKCCYQYVSMCIFYSAGIESHSWPAGRTEMFASSLRHLKKSWNVSES
jgi:hypothetical protein